MTAVATEARIITPQPGFQMAALSTPADIAIIGGGAGGGKTYALLIEASRHRFNKDFGAVIFRRTYAMVTNEGGLWDTSKDLYPMVGAKQGDLEWKFPSGARVSFAHMQHEKNMFDWQGTQIPLIIFDELTHFTKSQFWYMLTRNRSMCGVKPYIRASCNPDPDSWVTELIEWWIGEDGFPIPERAGKLRYLTRDGEIYVWGDTPEEVKRKAPHLFEGALANTQPKSVTFIPGSIYENKKLLAVNPDYLGNLMAQDQETRAQLLEGNWKVKIDGLALFEPTRINDLWTNYPMVEAQPRRCITCDAAGYGQDKCVIKVWIGWTVVAITVISKTGSRDIMNAIEPLRRRYNVAQSDTLIDQDGVGGGAVALGGYQGFSGGAPALPDPETDTKEAYKNLKTQCYYRMAGRVNRGEVRIEVTTDSCLIDDVRTTKMKVGGVVVDIRDVIKQDLKAIKRGKDTAEGKKTINDKEEQKILLGGRSPDFADTFSFREWFELRPVFQKGFMKRKN
ncbi:terminase family protein [Hymenobacter sp. UYP22]|uniref:terminase large subunit domain-containing protein n=1 Tax=Hymenobacter sp. UYP22 TaxID=3156348 RepID=UPI003390EF03